MKSFSKAMLASALTSFLTIGGVFGLEKTKAEAKTSMMYCGAPGNCIPHPYKPHGGYGAVQSVCARYRPCYLNSNCTGEEFCGSLQPPHPN